MISIQERAALTNVIIKTFHIFLVIELDIFITVQYSKKAGSLGLYPSLLVTWKIQKRHALVRRIEII